MLLLFPRSVRTALADLRCDDYGFDCNYSTKGNVEKVVFEYWNHMKKEHGIEYDVETIGNTIKRKTRQIRLFA